MVKRISGELNSTFNKTLNKTNMKKITMYALFAAVLTFAACGDDKTTIDDGIQDSVKTVNASTTDISGYTRGTLLAGKTYNMVGTVIIPENETLSVEPGVTIIVGNDGSGSGFQFTVNGTLAAIGTKAQPITFTVAEADRKIENIFEGLWCGFQGSAKAKAIVLKHCKVSYLGGQGGAGTVRAGKATYGIASLDPNTEIIVEDCHFTGSVDDMFRPNGGKINIVRNVFEFAGETGGDGLNIKGGTIGNIAYNVFIGGATNAYKVSNEGSTTIQTNVNVYNNIALNCGFRRAGNTRGANINYEVGARGYAYNNIVANCKRGMRALADADLPNIKFDHNLYYAAYTEMVAEKIPTDAVVPTETVLGANNIIGSTDENNPMWQNVDLKAFTMVDFLAGANQNRALNEKGTKDFRLKAGSPCIGKGTKQWAPVQVQWVVSGDLAPSIMQPSTDIGAYPLDNTGNQYF
jgi:hypothetical protein